MKALFIQTKVVRYIYILSIMALSTFYLLMDYEGKKKEKRNVNEMN